MMSGLVYGYVSLVEGMIERTSRKLSAVSRKPKVIATVGFAKIIAKHTAIIDKVDQDITLKGLKEIACQRK